MVDLPAGGWRGLADSIQTVEQASSGGRDRCCASEVVYFVGRGTGKVAARRPRLCFLSLCVAVG